jgi:hypothetical protein
MSEKPKRIECPSFGSVSRDSDWLPPPPFECDPVDPILQFGSWDDSQAYALQAAWCLGRNVYELGTRTVLGPAKSLGLPALPAPWVTNGGLSGIQRGEGISEINKFEDDS